MAEDALSFLAQCSVQFLSSLSLDYYVDLDSILSVAKTSSPTKRFV
jgi:hypothetical protein